MNRNTIVEKTLVIRVPEDQETVNLHLEIETSCKCAAQLNNRPGSYIDTEPRISV